ncbi:TPA: hypothetical protein ACRZZI_004954 [Vibrio harveyi]
MYGIGNYSGNKREAEYTYRDLSRAQWQDYQDRFLPYQEKLMDVATSTAKLDEQLGRISAVAGQSANMARQNASLAMSRYGIGQSAEMQQAAQSNITRNQVLNQANAMNNARSAAYDRYQSTMTGSAMRPAATSGKTGGASGT